MPSASSLVGTFAVTLWLGLGVGCYTPAPYAVTQHGLIGAPRPASYDGQPITGSTVIEGHASRTRIDVRTLSPQSGAAVAQMSAGGALRTAVNPTTDLGIEVDAGWSATSTTLAGADSESRFVPRDGVIDAAIALRSSWPVSEGFRIGGALALGAESSPIQRFGAGRVRDESFLMRAALVPSYRTHGVTVFASFGIATEADVPEQFVVVPSDTASNDPGAVADVKSVVGTGAVGVTLDLGDRVHLTTQISEAAGGTVTYGPQLTAGLTLELGTLAARSARAPGS